LKRKTIENKKANTKFAAGPAIAIKAAPNKGFFKLKGLYGTGFAQPKAILKPVIINENMGTKKEPTGSKCLKGFNDNLPISLAVVSPNIKAIVPCDTSCKINEYKITT